MKWFNLRYLLLFLVLLSFTINAQKVLQILKSNPGSFKKYEIFSGDLLEYKLKGEHFYKRNKIVNMNDSLVLFENDSVIKISEIKVIKLQNGNHLMNTFIGSFFVAGAGYSTLNLINNIILENSFRLDPRAIIISGSFLGAAFILHQLSIKRIRIKKNVTLKFLDLHYDKLNQF